MMYIQYQWRHISTEDYLKLKEKESNNEKVIKEEETAKTSVKKKTTVKK